MLHYERSWLVADIVAGLVLTAFLVPVGMGYAQASGLPPITGLYATILPLLVYALFGPSRVLVLGPDSSLVPVIAAVIAPLASADPTRALVLAGALAILTGLIIAGAGLLRLGFVTELLSRPVQLGYLAAIVVLIFAGQLPKLLGTTAHGDHMAEQLISFVRNVATGQFDGASAAVGLLGVVVLIACKRFVPKWPASLVAVVVGIAVTMAFQLGAKGVKVLGALPQGLPTPTVPLIGWSDLEALLPGALGIALVSVADTTVLSQTLAAQRREEVSPDQELVALGLANVSAGFIHGFPISSSSSRTPVAIAAGAKSQLTGVVGAVAICVLLVAGPNLLADLPTPVLAAIVLVAASGLVDVRSVALLYRRSKPELVLFLAAFLGVAFVGVIQGIFFAVVLSLGDFVRRAWRPHDARLGRVRELKGYHDLARYPHARLIPGLFLYRFDAPLFFANARYFRERVLETIDAAGAGDGRIRWVIVAAEPITDIDTTAGEVLERLHEELASRGVVLAFAEMKDPVKDRMRRYDLYDRFGADRFFPTLGTAVDAYVIATGVTWVDWEDEKGARQEQAG